MADLPPTLQRRKVVNRQLVLLLGLILFLGVGAFFAFRAIIATGITKGPDAMFGDQHLKTAVALVELHKVRFGKYPDDLRELKFTGQWDQIALRSVTYRTNADHTAYFLEVRRGWIGKPNLEVPDEFWQGTGYSESLRPR